MNSLQKEWTSQIESNTNGDYVDNFEDRRPTFG